ncbi:MAG: PEP-utilizing enzyme [bacterium]
MTKINFKRKKSGPGSWGVGLSYLLKGSWNDLDKIMKDSYYGRHNKRLINFLLPKVFLALEKAILIMERYDERIKKTRSIQKFGPYCIKKARAIQKFGSSARTLNEKVIFIDATAQFLRETSLEKRIAPKAKIKKTIKKAEIKEIKGIIASVGNKLKNITGVARIVLSEKDFSKIKKGDILVTEETDASFLPAIAKARAVVTDLGGILCHAAIVSREFEIPCVVGTKNATQVLKDGNLVEIDTTKGIVKILKRKN